MDDQLPYFGGAAGEPVPQVDPEDIKAAWKVGRDIESRHSGGPGLHAYAIGVEVFKAACKPGANIPAVCYRGMMLGVLTRHAQEQLAPWVKEGKVDDAVFLAIADVPMEWMGVGMERKGLPFDAEDFIRRVREAA